MESTTAQPNALNASDGEDSRSSQASKLFHTGVMLLYGKRKYVDKAIKCIQKAITFIDTDYKYWQFLGEAYYQRGSLNPAINCFMRSLKLAENDQEDESADPERRRADCTYSRLRMSDIRHSVGHWDEAALGYSEIIAVEPNNVAALIGLAKTELQLARNNFAAGLVKSGHLNCMKALEYSLKAINLSSHLGLTWKLASDCCIIQFVYGQRGDFKTEVKEPIPGNEQNTLVVDREICIDLAQQFLCKAIAIETFQESSCLWHNLGISIYLKSTIVKKVTEREALLRRSIKCLLKALQIDRDNSQVRNSIAIVSFNLNLLNTAQHFLIKSIQTNLSTSEIQFSNLGYMYLQKGAFNLASVAFARCQAEEPLYSRSWLGNALINEQMNIDSLSYLRHCHKLENNYDSQLMYATKVASSSYTEEFEKDMINALDCMRRIINYNDQSLEANNTLGLLYERSRYIEESKLCFDRAYNISHQDSRVIFNKLRQQSASKTCYLIDDTKFEIDATLVMSAEKLVNGANKEYLLNFIHYLFLNEDFRNVNTKVNKFMDKLPVSDVRSKTSAQILLGLVAKAGSKDFKSWLFKNIIDLDNITCIEALINLLCLMLFGALTKDHELVDQISIDLTKYLITYISSRPIQINKLFHSLEGRWIRLIMFCSIFCLKDQSKMIRPMLALFPMIAEMWLFMGLALMTQQKEHQLAVYCIDKAKLIGSTDTADLGVVCDILLSILSQSNKLKSGNRVDHLSRAIHKYPHHEILWMALQKASASKIDEKSRSNNVSSHENSGLYQLAMNITIRMILF